MEVPILILLTALACFCGWVYGEVRNDQPIRIISAIACMVVFSGIAGAASGLYTAVSIGVPFSTAVHEYLDATKVQLQEGNTEFVVNEFNGFKERAHITYESGAFLESIELETLRMSADSTTP